jgi:hypothetical protein
MSQPTYIFRTHSQIDSVTQYNGDKVIVLRPLSRDEADIEAGQMFMVYSLVAERTFTAFIDELSPIYPEVN